MLRCCGTNLDTGIGHPYLRAPWIRPINTFTGRPPRRTHTLVRARETPPPPHPSSSKAVPGLVVTMRRPSLKSLQPVEYFDANDLLLLFLFIPFYFFLIVLSARNCSLAHRLDVLSVHLCLVSSKIRVMCISQLFYTPKGNGLACTAWISMVARDWCLPYTYRISPAWIQTQRNPILDPACLYRSPEFQLVQASSCLMRGKLGT